MKLVVRTARRRRGTAPRQAAVKAVVVAPVRVGARLPSRGRRTALLASFLFSPLPPLLLLLALAGTGFDYRPFDVLRLDPATTAPPPQPAKLAAEVRRLERALRRLVPVGNYIVVDQTHNRLSLERNGEVLFEAVCSAGSGMVLREGRAGRVWVFDTPRGAFEVRSRTENPVWRKPDWAFVEEGLPIPSDPAERIEYGTLGEYALYLGEGYMIHGTLYDRLLGRSVTHGCIRLGRDDLRRVWRETRVGTPVFVF